MKDLPDVHYTQHGGVSIAYQVVGLGPIEFLLRDPDVTEVMVDGSDDVYVERKGPIERAPLQGVHSSSGTRAHTRVKWTSLSV